MFIPGKLEDRYYPRFFYALGINNLGLEIKKLVQKWESIG